MIRIHVARDVARPERIWLSTEAKPAPPQRLFLDVQWPFREDDAVAWRAVLHQAGAELGLQPGDVVVITANSELHAAPWEWLGGPDWQVNVLRASIAPPAAGVDRAPRPLRVLLALPEQTGAPLRVAMAAMEREGVLRLSMAEPTQLGAHLARRGYYHAVHVLGNAPALASPEKVRGQLGRGRVPLVVVHSEGSQSSPTGLMDAELTAALVLGPGLLPEDAAPFLATWYAAVLSGARPESALVAARAVLKEGMRHQAVWITTRLEGNIWPQPQAATGARPTETANTALVPHHASDSPAPGLVVHGNLCVGQDAVFGTMHKTVHQAEGDMVHLERGGTGAARTSLHQAGGDMVHIERRSADTRTFESTGYTCPACGGATEESHNFCGKCGRALRDA